MYIKSMSYLHECVSPIFSIPLRSFLCFLCIKNFFKEEAKVFQSKNSLISQLHLKGRCGYLEKFFSKINSLVY
jgi:hypothetical protein